MTESFYDLLGVVPDADDEAIRRAYRERLKETHPDVSEASDADERTRRLVDAKETLLDPAERRRYDRLGHDAYVGADDAVSTNAPSAAAREAAECTEAGEDDGTADGTSEAGGPTNARTGPYERRARERRARERVDAETDWTEDESDAGRQGDDRATGEADDRAASNGAGTSAWATNMSDPRVDPTVDPTARRRQPQSPWWTLRRSPATAMATFGMYPLLVAGAVFPPFPLYVNGIVAVCVLLLIAALQSMPAVGVFVFAAWSVIGAFGLAVASVHPISLLGLLVLGSTWFPLGLTVLTFWALRL